MRDLKNSKSMLNIIRWSSRIFSIFIVTFLWFMLIVHVLSDDAPGLGMFLFLLILPIGLLLAWKWELIGSALIFFCLVGYHLEMFFQGSSSVMIIYFDIAIITGILFFICWYFSRKSLPLQ